MQSAALTVRDFANAAILAKMDVEPAKTISSFAMQTDRDNLARKGLTCQIGSPWSSYHPPRRHGGWMGVPSSGMSA